MFGATLNEVMALQRDRFPQRELPWVQTTLTRQVLVRGGTLTEGIFRVSADADEVSALKSCLDRFEDGATLAASQDAHAPASLLKLWVRELYEPLIPDTFYMECVSMRHDDSGSSAISAGAIIERLPDLNRRVLCHLIRFLQVYFSFNNFYIIINNAFTYNNILYCFIIYYRFLRDQMLLLALKWMLIILQWLWLQIFYAVPLKIHELFWKMPAKKWLSYAYLSRL